jgi:radical SAM superfamily enzyme YgiQ (UPF0313 family)
MRRSKIRKGKINALLIFPRTSGGITSNDAFFPFPFLALTQLAAAFPSKYNIRIIDECVSPVSGKEDADIVFISTLTSTAFRAYSLGDSFLKRGIPVVMGGVHATILPEEAAGHATAVVLGEADEKIREVLRDFEKGSLLPLYDNHSTPDLDAVPSPLISLLNWRHRFFILPLQTSRGCPNNCDFCSVPAISGRKLRLKSISTVEKELEALKAFRSRYLFVVDDNFTVIKDRALALMDIFRHHGFRWMGFSTLSVSEDEEFLRALEESGCLSLFIGFESLHDQGTLLKNRQYRGLDSFRKAVARIHSHGIGIQGSFIFGFDHDTGDVFKETVSFIQETGIELPSINIMTPFPGTDLFRKLSDENRILHRDWSLYDMNHVVLRPGGMSPEELQQGYAWALKYLASPSIILSRLRKRFGSKSYFMTANFSLHRQQTRLARSLWNRDTQRSMQERGLCLC